jgi:hypothetical protein
MRDDANGVPRAEARRCVQRGGVCRCGGGDSRDSGAAPPNDESLIVNL